MGRGQGSDKSSSSTSAFMIVATIIISLALLYALYIFYFRDIISKFRESNVLPKDFQSFMKRYKDVRVRSPSRLKTSDSSSSININSSSCGSSSKLTKTNTHSADDNIMYQSVVNPLLLNNEDNDIENNFYESSSPPSPSRTLQEDQDELTGQINIDTIYSDLREVLKSGYLMKKSTGYQKAWLLRWFFIVDGKLYYCKSHTEQSQGKVTLVANLVNSHVKPSGNLGFIIESPGDRGSGIGGGVYQLQSPDDSHQGEEDIEDWIQCIKDEESSEQEYFSSKDVSRSILHSGYLKKKSSGLKASWASRWFFIVNGKLYYSHRPSDLNEGLVMATQVANLVISTVKEVSKLEFQIISPGVRGAGGGVFDLQGFNEHEVAQWVIIVRSQIEAGLGKNLTEEPPDANKQPSLLFVPSQSALQTMRKANSVCADCDADNPDWASWNLCIMMCIECSGIHRSMGTHISKVRSLTLDKWSQSSINLLTNLVGNSNSNLLWEETLNTSALFNKPTKTSSRPDREAYINNKYVKKLFVNENLFGEVKDDLLNLMKNAVTGNQPIEILRILISGFDVNSELQPTDGMTALHMAVKGKFPECVELLCQFNATIDKPSLEQIGSPLDLARNNASTSENPIDKLILDTLLHHLKTTSSSS